MKNEGDKVQQTTQVKLRQKPYNRDPNGYIKMLACGSRVTANEARMRDTDLKHFVTFKFVIKLFLHRSKKK